MAKPKLALIPAAQGTSLYSVLPSSGVGDFNFTRSGSATRINSQGLIETVASGVSRLNYPLIDGVVKGCPSHILEPQRTNLQTYSSDLASVYVPTNITQTSNYGVSPDGTLTSTRVVLSNLTNSRSVETLTGVLTNGVVYTFSCYYKGIKGESTYMYFLSSTGGVSVSKEIIFTGEWQRESITFTAGSASNYTYIVDVRQGSSTATDFQVWGGQVEQGSYPTSYIPTTTSTVTRSAETATGSGDAATFNDSEGVLMFEGSALANDGTFRILSLSNGGTSNEIKIQLSSVDNTIGYGVVVGGFPQIDRFYTTNSTLLNNKIAAKYKENDFSLFVNGFEVIVDTNGSVFSQGTLNELSFERGNNTSPFYSSTKQLQYYDTALTDSELETLTSWVSFTDMAEGQQYTIE